MFSRPSRDRLVWVSGSDGSNPLNYYYEWNWESSELEEQSGAPQVPVDSQSAVAVPKEWLPGPCT